MNPSSRIRDWPPSVLNLRGLWHHASISHINFSHAFQAQKIETPQIKLVLFVTQAVPSGKQQKFTVNIAISAPICELSWHIRRLTAAKWLNSGGCKYCPFKVLEWLKEMKELDSKNWMHIAHIFLSSSSCSLRNIVTYMGFARHLEHTGLDKAVDI